jgi:hypothetical protein
VAAEVVKGLGTPAGAAVDYRASLQAHHCIEHARVRVELGAVGLADGLGDEAARDGAGRAAIGSVLRQGRLQRAGELAGAHRGRDGGARNADDARAGVRRARLLCTNAEAPRRVQRRGPEGGRRAAPGGVGGNAGPRGVCDRGVGVGEHADEGGGRVQVARSREVGDTESASADWRPKGCRRRVGEEVGGKPVRGELRGAEGVVGGAAAGIKCQFREEVLEEQGGGVGVHAGARELQRVGDVPDALGGAGHQVVSQADEVGQGDELGAGARRAPRGDARVDEGVQRGGGVWRHDDAEVLE